jgi:hypothetical protein
MIVETIQANGHEVIKIVHITISIAFLIFAILVITRSAWGFIKHKEYSRFDRFLSYAFIISLYLQVFLGIILFSNLGIMSGYDYLGGDSSVKMVTKRLWPIEHIVMMIFAIMIATLGLILSIKARVAKDKHKKVLIYFMISILLVAQSLAAIYLF